MNLAHSLFIALWNVSVNSRPDAYGFALALPGSTVPAGATLAAHEDLEPE